MTLDTERIGDAISDIDKYFAILESFGITGEESLENLKTLYASSMAMLQIVNRAINIGEDLVHSKRIGSPKRYAEIFRLLGQEGVISRPIAESMALLARDRNVLAHEYPNIGPEEIFMIYQKIYGVNDFLEEVRKIVKKEAKNE